MATLDALIAGVTRMHERALDGARDGLAQEAATVTRSMQTSPAHGDATGASHANYNARVVGRGDDGGATLAQARAAAAALNPGQVGPVSTVAIDGAVGVILDSQMDYSSLLETENAGQKAVIGPAVGASGARFTQAAADGMKRALG